MNDFCILIFSETWISNKTSINLDINGYFSEHLYGTKAPGSSKGRYSGGLSLYAKYYLQDKIQIIVKNSKGLL